MRGAEELTCIKKAKLEYGGAHYFNPSAMTGIIKAIPNSAIRCFRIYSNCLFFLLFLILFSLRAIPGKMYGRVVHLMVFFVVNTNENNTYGL